MTPWKCKASDNLLYFMTVNLDISTHNGKYLCASVCMCTPKNLCFTNVFLIAMMLSDYSKSRNLSILQKYLIKSKFLPVLPDLPLSV